MKHYYFVSPYHPSIALKVFDWKVYEAAISEVESIIQNALARDFRNIQSNEIRELVRIRVCPKCRGKLFPCEDGMKCFVCGLIVYNEMYRPSAYKD